MFIFKMCWFLNALCDVDAIRWSSSPQVRSCCPTLWRSRITSLRTLWCWSSLTSCCTQSGRYVSSLCLVLEPCFSLFQCNATSFGPTRFWFCGLRYLSHLLVLFRPNWKVWTSAPTKLGVNMPLLVFSTLFSLWIPGLLILLWCFSAPLASSSSVPPLLYSTTPLETHSASMHNVNFSVSFMCSIFLSYICAL